ncbi:glycosyltransferase [Akkermansiaceae bacterium]|nr:glycosyltransferase [Akkermansiaceae bacterium]MDB4423416.1 glycosyltransferase [bacterium]
MNTEKIKPIVALQQAIIPDYRMGLFRLLRRDWGDTFEIYAGDFDFGKTPISTDEAWQHFKRVKNYYFFGNRFLWQQGCFRKLLSADIVILNANMRIVSNTALLVLRKILGRRTILWGHSKGQNGVAEIIRGVYFSIADGFIAYTKKEGMTLRYRCPRLMVWVAANSCLSAANCVPVEGAVDELDSILYVGRLVEKKKVRLLLEGFILATKRSMLAEHIRLVFVGAGSERQFLEGRAEEAGVSERVHFAGHVSNITGLREYYRKAICSVSPGYVGLSATQSFSFGVPMLIARDEFHSPEIEACKEGFNTEFFESNDPQSLADHLHRITAQTEMFHLKRKELSTWTASHYSFEVMQKAFKNAVKNVGGLD